MKNEKYPHLTHPHDMDIKSLSDSDLILWSQFVKSSDAKNAFDVWKRNQLKLLNEQNNSSVIKQDQPQYSATNPPPGQAYLYTPEFDEWCRKRDAQGLDY